MKRSPVGAVLLLLMLGSACDYFAGPESDDEIMIIASGPETSSPSQPGNKLQVGRYWYHAYVRSMDLTLDGHLWITSVWPDLEVMWEVEGLHPTLVSEGTRVTAHASNGDYYIRQVIGPRVTDCKSLELHRRDDWFTAFRSGSCSIALVLPGATP